jgi:peptidoglycan/xylan/chitin deacetylase (PgdA/CDA1 family)
LPSGPIKTLLHGALHPLVTWRTRAPGVWLTFDDGPHPRLTPLVLAALERARVRATFFLLGREMESQAPLVAAIREAGHEAALHGYEHRHARELGVGGQLEDLRRMRDAAARLGLPLRHYRPAYGELTPARLLWCLRHRVRIVMWSFESRDSFAADASAVAARATPSALAPGTIALFHDDTPATAEALPLILERALATGVRFTDPA